MRYVFHRGDLVRGSGQEGTNRNTLMTGEGNAWLKLGRRLLRLWIFFLLWLSLMGQVNAASEYG